MRTRHLLVNDCPVLLIELQSFEAQCVICDAWGHHEHFVWYYEGPCCSVRPEKGGAVACKSCHDKWAAWDDDMILIANAYGVNAILDKRFPA